MDAKKTLKVCLLTDAWRPILGGGQTHAWEIGKRLVQEHGCTVDIVTRALKDEDGKKYSQDETFFGGRLRVHRIGPATSFQNPAGRLLFLATPLLRLLSEKYDVVNAQAPLTVFPAKLGKLLRGYRLVYTVHGNLLFTEGKSFGKRLHKKLICETRYDKLISVSKNILTLPNVNKDIRIIPNGVDAARFDLIAAEKPEKFRILYVGRFDSIKGVDYLIKAIGLIPEGKRGFELHLIGYGYDEKKLKALVQEQRLEETIRFRGRIEGDGLIREYKSANLFVLPSLSEGQPLTLLEAWAAHLPVIVTDVGDNRSMVDEGRDGYVVAPKDAQRLAGAILAAVENKNLAELGECGYEKVREKFTWEKAASAVFDAYQS
jgi:glycosyltransferase involved in cell wall biosynthesis